MLFFIKFLKIVLPVATVTSATIATVSLVSFQKLDNKLNKETEDRVLEDFEVPAEKFEEQEMLYAKDGEGNNVSIKDEKQKQQLLKEFKENNGRLEKSGQTFDELKYKGLNSSSDSLRIENKDEVTSKTSDLKNVLSDGDQPNQEDQVSSQPLSQKPDDFVSGKNSEDIVTQQDIEEAHSKINNQKDQGEDPLSKNKEVEGEQVTSKLLTSGEEGIGKENCEPCPKEEKSTIPQNNEKESEGLDKPEGKDKKEVSSSVARESKAYEENGDVPAQTNDSTSSTSELNKHEESGGDGILNEETSNSSLTSPEQLEALNGLYGEVTDVLSQLQSRFSL